MATSSQCLQDQWLVFNVRRGDHNGIWMHISQKGGAVLVTIINFPFLLALGQQFGVWITQASNLYIWDALQPRIMHRATNSTDADQPATYFFFWHDNFLI